MNVYNLVSLLGIFMIAAVAWLFSTNRRVINWRVIIWGIGLQMMFAIFIFVTPTGSRIFHFINNIVVIVLDSATAGTQFVFGPLALPAGTTNAAGETSPGVILAFQGLAPGRLKDLSRLGLRALLAGTLACLMTGAVAGAFYTKGSTLLGL